MYPLDFEIWSDLRRFSPVWDQIELINPLCVFMSAVKAEQNTYCAMHWCTSLPKEVSSVIQSYTTNGCILMSTKIYKEKYGWRKTFVPCNRWIEPSVKLCKDYLIYQCTIIPLWCLHWSEPVVHYVSKICIDVQSTSLMSSSIRACSAYPAVGGDLYHLWSWNLIDISMGMSRTSNGLWMGWDLEKHFWDFLQNSTEFTNHKTLHI